MVEEEELQKMNKSQIVPIPPADTCIYVACTCCSCIYFLFFFLYTFDIF